MPPYHRNGGVMNVAIVGAGSAGLFAAYKLKDINGISVDIFEMGKSIDKRSRKEILSGFGGAGAFSDGKLTLSEHVGGWLHEIVGIEKVKSAIKNVDFLWSRLSGVTTVATTGDYERIKEIEYRCSLHKLRLVAAKYKHLGTDNSSLAVKRMYEELKKSNNINIFCETRVEDLIVRDDRVEGVVLHNGDRIPYDVVVLAVGRIGNSWMQQISSKYSISYDMNPIDIGVRVEVNREVTDPFTNYLYEFKILYLTSEFEDNVRTFCVNPGGFVTIETNQNNLHTVNGHSYKEKKSENTNFALLVSTKFTEPFKDPVRYGEYIAYLANMLGGGSVIVQRFGDLTRGRRSTHKRIEKNFVRPTLSSAMPGDLSFILPYRYIADIKETIYQLDKVMPGLADPNTLLYGVEAKFYSLRVNVDEKMRSKNLQNLYCIGDGAGITRSIVHASVSGLVAAEDIIRRLKSHEKP